jgi:hypothetical protein
VEIDLFYFIRLILCFKKTHLVLSLADLETISHRLDTGEYYKTKEIFFAGLSDFSNDVYINELIFLSFNSVSCFGPKKICNGSIQRAFIFAQI